MKRQLSRYNRSGTYFLFWFSVRRMLGITILLSAFALLICPSYLLILIHRFLKSSPQTVYAFREMATAVSSGTAVLSSLATVFYLFLNFQFLYTRNASDFFHALPVKRRSILLSRFFAAIVSLLIPVLLVYGSMLIMLTLPYIQGEASVILIGFLYTLLLMLLTGAVTLIFLLAAGNAVDFLLSFATFQFGTLFLHIMMEELCQRFLRGFGIENSFPFYWINPIYFGFEGMLSDPGFSKDADTPRFALTVPILLLLIAAFLFLALFLYQRRKSEKSGQGHAFRFVYDICMMTVGVFGAFAVGSIFSDARLDFSYLLFSAAGGVLAVIAYGAILNRGFKTVRRSAVLGSIAWIMAAAISFSFSADIFGFAARLPEKSEIRYAEVSVDWMQTARFYEPEPVLALHKKAIPEPESFESTLSLRYVMKDGSIVTRYYEIDTRDVSEELLTLYKSEEHKKAIRDTVGKFADDQVVMTVEEYGENPEEPTTYEITVTRRAFDAWLGIYLADLSNATEKSFSPTVTTCSVDAPGKDGSYQYLQFYLEPGFRNTRDALSSLKEANR